MSAADVQKGLTDRMSKAGNAPKSVTCQGDLTGEVGKTDSCEVVMNDDSSFQANVTVTKVGGSSIDYDTAASLTQEQLQNEVAGMTTATSVTCAAGLEGKVGASTTCQVTKDGATQTNNVAVSKVNGLDIDIAIS